GARGAPADLLTLPGFLNHVLALGFRGDFFHFVEPAILWERFKVMGNVLTFQFHPWLLAGMAAGLAALLWRDRKLAVLLGGSFALHTFVTATYRAPQTVEYMLPAYIPAAICLGYALALAQQAINPTPHQSPITQLPNYPLSPSPPHLVTPSPPHPLPSLLIALLCLATLRQALAHYPSYAALHQDTSARDYAQIILEQVPPGSVVLADWHWATSLWYLQEVEGQRPDLAIHFVFPTGEPYAQTWARRIAEEHAAGRPVVATHFDEGAYTTLPPPEPVGEAFLFRQEPRTALPAGYQPLDLSLGDTIQLLGYHLEQAGAEIGRETILTLAWRPTASLPESLSLFAHLVGQDSQLYAQDDPPTHLQPAGLTLTRFRLTPRPGTPLGPLSVMVGARGTDPLLDPAGQPRTAIATLAVTAMSWPPFTHHPLYRTVPGGRPLLRLIGYDWDNTLPGWPRLYLHWQTEQGYQTEVHDPGPDSFELPAWFGPWGLEIRRSQLHNRPAEHYVPFGQGIVWTGRLLPPCSPAPLLPCPLSQFFHSSRPVLRDLVVSVRLVGYQADGVHWAWWDLDDGVPALGAIPTLKWIAGSAVRDPHRLLVDPAAHPGQSIGALLTLYDAFTGRPLPILDERISQTTPWVPLGITTLQPVAP
ncbi:MAG: hypothetical protein L0322_27350, partial [Chloroflexi bacterium]|nr:hypothetical protein [Chloroflexota bacterium]